MLPFGVTIPATLPQRTEILEGLMSYPVLPRKDSTFISFSSVFNFDSKIFAEFTDVVKCRVCGKRGREDKYV
jgi:hypothetical protein